jgi:hypothetical protein
MKGLLGQLSAALLALLLVGPASGQEGSKAMTIQGAKTKHELRLLAMPGVVSVGIGLDSRGNAAIIVGLDGPRPETVEKLPKTLEGYPVQIQIIGPVKAQPPKK